MQLLALPPLRRRIKPLFGLYGFCFRPRCQFGTRETDSNSVLPATAIDDIESKLARLKVAQLNEMMRDRGIVQGVGKAHKVATLGSYILQAQKLALDRFGGKKQRVSRHSVHKAFVPQEVVSVDIGFKNLAYAHISCTGKLLEWKRIELLQEATFEPWTLARVVEEFVRDTLPARPAAVCTYIIEHQRFRSQGSAAVTNSTMLNNLIEALLFANLRHSGAYIEPVNPAMVSAHWGLTNSCGANNTSESVGKLVARLNGTLSAHRQLTSLQHELIQRFLGKTSPSRCRKMATPDEADSKDHSKVAEKKLGLMREARRRLIKKQRSIAMVQAWILSSLAGANRESKSNGFTNPTEQLAEALEQEKKMGLPGTCHLGDNHSRLQVASAIAEMFGNEKKKDDLCDCLIQGVAWYNWQHRAVAVLDEYCT